MGDNFTQFAASVFGDKIFSLFLGSPFYNIKTVGSLNNHSKNVYYF